MEIFGFFRRIKRWWNEPGHHWQPEPKEIVRSTSPNGKLDLVVYVNSGTNLGLAIVKKRSRVFSNQRVSMLIHVDLDSGVEVEWINDHRVKILAECQDFVANERIAEVSCGENVRKFIATAKS